MRIRGEIEIGCPNCGESNRVLVWDTISGQLGQEAQNRLLCGGTNVFRCRRCQKAFAVETSLLYNEMENRFAVCYFPFALVQKGHTLDAMTLGGPMRSRRCFPEGGYAGSIHYVFDMYGLLRYIESRDVLAEVLGQRPG